MAQSGHLGQFTAWSCQIWQLEVHTLSQRLRCFPTESRAAIFPQRIQDFPLPQPINRVGFDDLKGRNSGPKSAKNQHFRPISTDFSSSSFFLCNRKPTPSSSNSTVSTTGRPRRLPLHRHQHHWECSPSSSTSFLPPGLHPLRRCACTISLHFTVQVKYNSRK